MTPVQTALLKLLKAHARKSRTCPTNEQLGELLATSTGVVSTNIKLLADDGWISIEHKGGRRRVYISGTDDHTGWTVTKSHWGNPENKKQRKCLKCLKMFDSGGPGNRICKRCADTKEYRSLGSAFEI
tara:strand:- start:2286 stop:2669 length:384 start_codon:yes stop_codon:yes gene_type:complete